MLGYIHSENERQKHRPVPGVQVFGLSSEVLETTLRFCEQPEDVIAVELTSHMSEV